MIDLMEHKAPPMEGSVSTPVAIVPGRKSECIDSIDLDPLASFLSEQGINTSESSITVGSTLCHDHMIHTIPDWLVYTHCVKETPSGLVSTELNLTITTSFFI